MTRTAPRFDPETGMTQDPVLHATRETPLPYVRKYPGAVRLAIIGGSAAASWALILLFVQLVRIVIDAIGGTAL